MPREHFHEALERVELEILAMGELAAQAVHEAIESLVHRDGEKAGEVIAGDDAIDEKYMRIDTGTLELLALQTPVATDLRLISAMLHINHCLERVGDHAVNIAKVTLLTIDLPTEATILTHIREMGDLAGQMIRTSMEAFSRRDLQLCLQLPRMDDPLDRLNRGMSQEVVNLAEDTERLQWGMHMQLVARSLERVGDNAVDIGEQVGFLLTGEFREYTDASHPVEVEDR
jgi:phosphate transport system protein